MTISSLLQEKKQNEKRAPDKAKYKTAKLRRRSGVLILRKTVFAAKTNTFCLENFRLYRFVRYKN